MKIKTLIIALAVALVGFGAIYYLEADEEEHSDNEGISLNLSSEESINASDAYSISGNTSILEVSQVFGIDEAILKEAFCLGDEVDLSTFETRDLEHYYLNLDESVEVGNESMQAFVALYNNLDFELEDIYLSTEGIALLNEYGKLNAEQQGYFESHGVEITEVSLADVEIDSESDDNYSGNTSLQDVINSGITLEEIETITGISISDTNILLRDYAEDNGLSYGGLKEDLKDYYVINVLGMTLEEYEETHEDDH